MTLLTDYSAATSDATFLQKIQVAIVQTGVNMMNEVNTTTNHANRMVLMKAVLNAPSQYASIFAMAVASQGIDNTATDSTIQSTCSTVWNAVAGMP